MKKIFVLISSLKDVINNIFESSIGQSDFGSDVSQLSLFKPLWFSVGLRSGQFTDQPSTVLQCQETIL